MPFKLLDLIRVPPLSVSSLILSPTRTTEANGTDSGMWPSLLFAVDMSFWEEGMRKAALLGYTFNGILVNV